jgi:hypothetical protein
LTGLVWKPRPASVTGASRTSSTACSTNLVEEKHDGQGSAPIGSGEAKAEQFVAPFGSQDWRW